MVFLSFKYMQNIGYKYWMDNISLVLYELIWHKINLWPEWKITPQPNSTSCTRKDSWWWYCSDWASSQSRCYSTHWTPLRHICAQFMSNSRWLWTWVGCYSLSCTPFSHSPLPSLLTPMARGLALHSGPVWVWLASGSGCSSIMGSPGLLWAKSSLVSADPSSWTARPRYPPIGSPPKWGAKLHKF